MEWVVGTIEGVSVGETGRPSAGIAGRGVRQLVQAGGILFAGAAVTPDPERAGWVLVGTETSEVWRVSADGAWTQLGEGLPAVQALLAMA